MVRTVQILRHLSWEDVSAAVHKLDRYTPALTAIARSLGAGFRFEHGPTASFRCFELFISQSRHECVPILARNNRVVR